jgi:hypothetical protein
VSAQSNVQMALVSPAGVPLPAPNYYALFLADGSAGTAAGVLYRKDSAGAVTIAQNTGNDFSNAKAQDAVGGILQNTDTVQLVYDTGNRLISANVPAGSIATTHLVNAGVTNAKLASMPQATFKMRAAASGTGAPVDGTAVQAKAALAIAYSDVTGLNTAATQPAAAFDTAGSAAAVQAASQPLDSGLTAISALTTTSYGRGLLTVADVAALTALPNIATSNLKGLLAPDDKVKLDNRGQLDTITSNQTSSALIYKAVLTAAVPGGMPTGTNIRVKLYGYATASGTVSFRIYAGSAGTTSDTVVWTSTTSPTLSTNQRGGFDGLLTMRSATNVICEAHGYGNTTMMPAATATPVTASISTSNTWYVTLATEISLLGGFSTLIALVEAV